MTDNRTTELRGKLTERGVEYTTNDHMGAYETSWNGFTATQLSPNANLIMAVTPEQAIAATLGSGTLTAEDVRSFLNRNSVFDDTTWMHGRQELVFDEDDLQAMADELNAALGGGECKVVASSTDGLTSDEPKQLFELSCGHTFKIYGLDVPVACPVCGKAVD